MLLSLPSMFNSLIEKNQRRPKRNFLCIAIGSWFMFAFVFLVPNVAVRLHFPRIFHILAFFIFPYSISTISGENFRLFLGKFGKAQNSQLAYSLTPAILISLFLLSSGFVYQLTDEGHRATLDSDMDYAKFSEAEEAGSIWQHDHSDDPDSGLDARVLITTGLDF